MKINKIIYILLTAAILAACEVVPEGDRFEKMEYGPSDRTVLLIEFTGVRCVNCPDAAAVANDMVNAFPENIVVVGMHPDAIFTSTKPIEPELDFRSSEAMEYLKFYGGSTGTGFPTGVVNGRQFNDKYLQSPHSTWISQVISQRAIQPDCNMKLKKSKKADDYTISVELTPTDKLNYKVSLQMWLLENGFVGSQATHEGWVRDYHHNHVFRECINDIWGDEIEVLNDTTYSYTFDVEEKYKEENCSVVAVLINTETKEVVQAKEISLGEGIKH